MYGNRDNLESALLLDKGNHFIAVDLARELARRDFLLIDEALQLIEKYKKLGVNDYDELMTWITEIESEN